ncbi:MAG: hypothetical protein PHO00_02180 [bacterium]|nr:hypothetical protein [bacterium]
MKKTGFSVYILFFAFFVFARGLNAENIRPSADVFVDKSYIKIGQPVRYTIRAVYPYEAVVEFPEFLNKIGDLEIVSFKHNSAKMKTADFIQDEYVYVLSGYNIGGYIIPSAEIKVIFPGGRREVFRTEEIYIEIRSVLGENPEDIKDIKGVLPGPSFIVHSIIISTLLILIVPAFVLLIRTGKKRFSLFREKYLPPHERAFNALKDLRESDLINRGLVKMFYFSLSSIIRRYIEERFGLNATEETTEEFLKEMADSDVFSKGKKDFLKRFLKRCDEVKFANHIPSGEEMVASFEDSVRFIDDTRQTEKTGLENRKTAFYG